MSRRCAGAGLAGGLALAVLLPPLAAGCGPWGEEKSERSFTTRLGEPLEAPEQGGEGAADGGRRDLPPPSRNASGPRNASGHRSAAASARRMKQKQEQYQRQISAELDDINRHLDDVERELEQLASAADTSDLPRRVENLKQGLADARKKAKKRRAKTRRAWEDLVATLDETVAELNSATKGMQQLVEPSEEPPGGQANN